MLNDPAGHQLTLAKPLTQSSHQFSERFDGVHVRFEEGGPAWGSGGVATLVVRAFGRRVGGHYKSEGASIRPEGDRRYRRGALWQCPDWGRGNAPIRSSGRETSSSPMNAGCTEALTPTSSS